MFAALAVNAASTFYLSPNGNDANNGSEGAPFATFKYAVSKLSHGSTLNIAPGTYPVTELVETGARQITIRGTSPNAADVVLDGQGTSRIFLINTVSNTLANITFRGGYGEFVDAQYGNRWRNSAVYFANKSGNKPAGSDIFNSVTNCVFDSCTNMCYSGAALTVEGGTRVVDCVFTNCYDASVGDAGEGNNGGAADGGVVFVIPPSKDRNVEFEGCKFVDNVNAGKGCACISYGVYAYSSDLQTNATGVILKDCDFIRNTTAGDGGVINAKLITLDGCNFVSNTCTGGGALLRGFEPFKMVTDDYIMCVTNQLLNCNFIGNVVGSGEINDTETGTYGMYVPGAYKNTMMSNCVFKLNVAPRGVVYTTVSILKSTYLDKLTMMDCVLEGNFATLTNQTYAGISQSSIYTACDMLRCSCITNEAQSWASGLHCGGGSTVRLCKFIGNKYTEYNGLRFGGALFFEGGTNYVEGCLFVGNTNHTSWGMCINANGNNPYYGGRAMRVWNCTFAHNYGGPALYGRHGSNMIESDLEGCETVNCVFYDNVKNSNNNVSDFVNDNWQGVRNCYGMQVVNGKNESIRGDAPQFTDEAAGDFTLQRPSPCRNAGLNADWMANAVDLLGAPRLDPVYSRVDMGCYELITPFGMTIQLR